MAINFSLTQLLLVYNILVSFIVVSGNLVDFDVIKGTVNEPQNFQINNTRPNAHIFNLSNMGDLTKINLRVETTVDPTSNSKLTNAEKDCPLIFEIRQARAVKLWALPLQVDTDSSIETLYEGSHTICVDTRRAKSETSNDEFLIVASTCISQTVNYSLNFVADSSDSSFVLKVNDPVTNVDLSPSVTRFFRFDFENSSDRVLVKIDSDDEICMQSAVQSPWCALVNAASNSNFFQKNGMEYKNFWQDMTNKAVIPVSKNDFPQGFYVGFTVHANDKKCESYNGVSSDSWTPMRTGDTKNLTKFVNITIIEEIPTKEYLIPLLYPLFYSIGLTLFTLIVFLIFSHLESMAQRASSTEIISSPVNVDQSILVQNDELSRNLNTDPFINPGHGSSSSEITFIYQGDSIDSSADASTSIPVSMPEHNETIDCRQFGSSSSSSDSFPEGHFSSVLPNINFDHTPTAIVTPLRDVEGGNTSQIRHFDYTENDQWLTIDAFINRTDMHHRRSMGKTYLQIITVGIFYILPTFQLSYTYHQISDSMGSVDLCFRNFECSHKILGWEDFNHIYSNIFYVWTGLIFCLFVRRYQIKVRKLKSARRTSNNENVTQNPSEHGVIYEFGVFYGLGCSLIIEGVLSGAYHVCPTSVNFQFAYHICPNQNSFQFDTSFMYILGFLSAIKIYQFRHGCLICPHNTFGLLALIVFFSLMGLLLGSKIFESIFCIFHFIAIILLSIYMYYVGHIKDTDGNPVTGYAIFNQTGLKRIILKEPISFLKPKHSVRLFYVIPFIIFNISLNIWQLLSENDFPMYLLYLFAGNMMLYFLHYFTMKIFHGEMFNIRSGQAFIFLMVSVVLGLWGVLNFLDKRYSAKLSPAESRALNKSCDWSNFYDSHDVWHFLSAGSIFFFFMTLLTIDDGILDKPRKEIIAF